MPTHHPGETTRAAQHQPALTVERVPTIVYPSSDEASRAVAGEIASLIRARRETGKTAVLGLPTGSTPMAVYDELVRLHREEGLSFANVVNFNLDEYWPMQPEELQSYRRFMREHLFDHIDIDPNNIHIPDGTIPIEAVDGYCRDYEAQIERAGGIDLLILGIGRTGHIGFNEPGSPRDSRTRLITLDRVTRMDAASDFFGEWNVPRKAITMGVGTILDARRLVLLAFGEHKAPVLQKAVEEPVTPSVAASFLQEHRDARLVVDRPAAAVLTRFRTPWLLGPVENLGLVWNQQLTRKATIWLATRLKKAILKLTDEDYNENGLQQLLSARGSAYDINIEVFKSLQHTITGWPGGKPDAANRDGTPQVFPKRIVVFSPHPDDDVISMGGTLIRLCEQGHDVHVAYQTSGNIAVFDANALRHADFVQEFCQAFKVFGAEQADRIEDAIQSFVKEKDPGEVDSEELRLVKTLIRRSEARSAATYSGVRQDHIHFLDLPFYETGRVRKNPLTEADIRIIRDLLCEVQPHQIYAAGDLSDPHGTHRVCLRAIYQALADLGDAPWLKTCELWLYRGAWQEWGAEDIEMAVPLSPDEVMRKRLAIFKHESQKDRALFPGPDDAREFWQRAEDRNRRTAALFDALGLAEYEAIEGFVQHRLEPASAESRA